MQSKRVFKRMGALALGATSALPGAAVAQGWQEYAFPEDGFSAHFASRPAIVERAHPTTQSPGGVLTERLYVADEGGVIYSVGVTDFSGLDADSDVAVGEVVSELAAVGTLAFETSIYVDQMHGSGFVVIGTDGTRYTNGIFFVKNRLYQVKVIYPPMNTDPAGSSGISLFQAKFQFLDPF